MIRVLIADDQELVRTGFRLILLREPGIEVIGDAANGREAVAAARRHGPDVVLMDIRMPVLDGIAATRELVLFHEYFNGDTGEGLGASHQTGWTALVAKLLQQSGTAEQDS